MYYYYYFIATVQCDMLFGLIHFSGRRGIFDGTVENMHFHWKHRELVKIISKERSLAEVKYTALMLESESGGLLVSVDKVSKGYAIIVYRGKNYQRPLTIKPKNLLTKRKALQRSKELQRCEVMHIPRILCLINVILILLVLLLFAVILSSIVIDVFWSIGEPQNKFHFILCQQLSIGWKDCIAHN